VVDNRLLGKVLQNEYILRVRKERRIFLPVKAFNPKAGDDDGLFPGGPVGPSGLVGSCGPVGARGLVGPGVVGGPL